MDERIVIGEIVKVHGLGGEVKINPYTNDVFRFKKLRMAYIDSTLCQIIGVRIDKGCAFVKFAGVDSREKAEAFIGKQVKIDRIHALATDDDEFFIADLLSCKFASDDGRHVGKVSNVWQHGAADVIEIDLDNGDTLLFPFLKSLGLKMDTLSKKITVKAEELEKVAVINNSQMKTMQVKK